MHLPDTMTIAPTIRTMTDLLLDPAIRSWVFVPIIVIVFLIGIIRHYAYLLLVNKKKSDLQNLKDSHYLAKARILRENGRFLPANGFAMRKYFLNDEEHGYMLKRVAKQTSQPSALDPSMITDMLKGNMLNMIPMIFIGGWINWTFSGFVATKVPFPLTLRFKPMLQAGINLASLDAAWVSSASWYFLNAFGLRSVYNLVLGGENAAESVMDEQMQGAPQAPPDPQQAFKAEWEALQLYSHSFRAESNAVSLIMSKIDAISRIAELKNVNMVDTENRNNGIFTNIVARIGPKGSDRTNESILLNSHFDTVYGGPGASDNGAACAIMLEILDVLAHSDVPLKHHVIFLFNGAEENGLKGSKLFIAEHPWRQSIRAFINMDARGAGGRALLFRSTPGASWILDAYAASAPYPYWTVMAQEVFKLHLIPSNTDFSIFANNGDIPGVDIAYVKNSWVYHTSRDSLEAIQAGSIQQSGANVLALARTMLKSEEINEKISVANSPSDHVFYDFVGLFAFSYSLLSGSILYGVLSVGTFIIAVCRIQCGQYSIRDLLLAIAHHLIVFISMLLLGSLQCLAISLIGARWFYVMPLVAPIYVLPMTLFGIGVHFVLASRMTKKNSHEKMYYEAGLLILASILAIVTISRIASAYLFFFPLIFALLRVPLLYLVSRFFGFLGEQENKFGQLVRNLEDKPPRLILVTQLVTFLPASLFLCAHVKLFFDVFLPLLANERRKILAQFMALPVAYLGSSFFVLFTGNLAHISRKLAIFFFIVTAIILVLSNIAALIVTIVMNDKM
ncbi:integral membrane protein DUF106 domain-containing protein [Ditylenchus destructor]|nr:integral membrane protein DUF106 domain-containing protein [Ditylenchus destructor]